MSTSRPRIHYLSHAAVPSAEANSLQVMKMCAALAPHASELVLHCRAVGDVSGAHAHYGVPATFRIEGVRRGKLPLLGRAAYSARVQRRLRDERAPALLFGRDYHTLALIALRRRPDLPMVLEVHQPPGSRVEAALLAALVRSPRFLRLVTISNALEEEYVRLYGARLEKKTLVAHDGADAPPPASAVEREREPGPPRLGYVGNLYPGKGMETIGALSTRLPDCTFHVIGGTPEDVAGWRARIAGSNVVFHGHVPHAEAQARMRTCDVLLAPFRRGVWIGGARADISRWMSPLKVFEYMASGRPMVASDLPVLREVLRPGENALLADPDDPEAWVRPIRTLLADPALARTLARRALAELAGEYTWERRAERVLADLPGIA